MTTSKPSFLGVISQFDDKKLRPDNARQVPRESRDFVLPSRFEVTTNELINDELGIAYPIIDGIPNMIPQEARLVQKDSDSPAQE